MIKSFKFHNHTYYEDLNPVLSVTGRVVPYSTITKSSTDSSIFICYLSPVFPTMASTIVSQHLPSMEMVTCSSWFDTVGGYPGIAAQGVSFYQLVHPADSNQLHQ